MMTSFWKVLKQSELILFALLLVCMMVLIVKKTPDI